MASTEYSSFSIDSKLSVVLKRQPDFLDHLALCLDRNMRLIPNWKQLARELNVDEDVIKKLEHYKEQSPTIRLFEYLEVTQPQLTIQQLRKAMLDIRRNDLCRLLSTNGEFAGSDKVQEVMTSQPHSPSASLLDEIALALDATSPVLANWYHLAIKLGVPRKDCWKFERRSTQSPTNELFQYLETTRPQTTLKELKDILHLMKRNDLLDHLTSQGLEDAASLKDVMTPGSELLQTMADKLDREIPGSKGWRQLAYNLDVPVYKRQAFGGLGQNGKSPTKEAMQWLVARFPDTTLKDVVKALDRIQRNDAIQIITRQFPDTVDSSLERLDSSLYDRVSIGLPNNDLTWETLSPPHKKKECGPFKDIEQPGHCGSLPDSTYLVGRDDTCEQIITLLTSNKAAEIVAPPGYGKTSVVVEVAHRMIKRGKFVAYVNHRGVTCVEDLGSKIIEALGAVAEEDPIKESLRRLMAFEAKSVVLIIENIDNLLHIEYQVSNEEHDQKSGIHCFKMLGKYKKDDFLVFLADMGRCPAIHLILTSRETVDFSVRFASELIELEPLSDDDSATLFKNRDKSLDNELVRKLVSVCGGIPLVICTLLAILKPENPQNLARMLSPSTPRLLLKKLSPDFIANEDRIDKCLEVCFNRLSGEMQDVLVKISTFPHGFTEEHFVDVFKPPPGLDLQTCMNRLKHSSLVRFDRRSCHYSFNPFLRDYFSLMPQHTAAKSVFIRHYSDLTTTLCKQFLSRDSKSAIEHYRKERENIREAMAWCGDDHPELGQTLREHCIRSLNKSAVFLAKVMRKQEFESLFCKLSYRCRYDMHLYSACLTNMGMKIVLSCTCTPHICPIALYRAKCLLSRANEIQSSLVRFDDATRAQCLSKLAICFVREGHFDSGYDLLDQALKLTKERTKHSVKKKDKVMLAACHNDLAACQMMQRKHLAAIETRRLFVLPDYENILGDHPFVATTLSLIANSYHALGDYDNAIKCTRRALEIREQQLGHHQETARSFYDLGVAHSAKEEYESALESLKKAVSLQEEVLDTHDELIHTHQAMSVVLKALGREEEAEWEMEQAGECAKRLDSLEVPLEILQTNPCEEMSRLVVDVPISSRQTVLKTQNRLSVKQNSDTLGRKEKAEREIEPAGKSAKSLDYSKGPLEKFETCEEKEWEVSDLAPISSKQAVDERVVRNETMKFEAEHEECVRVLPYQLENGDVEIQLYIYGDKSGIPTKLKKAAQAFFGQYGWKLKWKDLYNDAFNVLQVTSIEYSSGQPKRLEASQVDEIEGTINKHLQIFSNHRNVTAVQPFFKVTKSIQTEEACIVVYVLGKGQIPMGEKAIPPAIGPYRVDIVNGFCVRTNDPYMPIEAHKQKDFLRLGASIGVYGKQSSGTLGAIVEDEKSGTLYALSCHHVMHDSDESRIIHPGFDVYLNCLRFNLNGYKAWIERITGLDLQLPASSDEAELQKMFAELKTKKEMHVDLEGCSNSAKEQITIFEKNLEEAFGKRPRVIASYSAGVRRNVRSDMSGRDHFIDAAISELGENEVKNVKAEKFLQIIDTTHYPSGKCISATTNETMNVEEVFKSGSATGFTESSLILGSSQSLPTFIKDFRQNGDFAWIDVDCINCRNKRTAQTQVQEPDPCEQCQEHSGWLKSCLCIQQHGTKPFSDKGDSGAVIFEKLRKKNRKYQLSSDGFGIIFAELPTQIGIFAIASPLETALKALSQKVSESRPDSEPCQLRLASSFR